MEAEELRTSRQWSSDTVRDKARETLVKPTIDYSVLPVLRLGLYSMGHNTGRHKFMIMKVRFWFSVTTGEE